MMIFISFPPSLLYLNKCSYFFSHIFIFFWKSNIRIPNYMYVIVKKCSCVFSMFLYVKNECSIILNKKFAFLKTNCVYLVKKTMRCNKK